MPATAKSTKVSTSSPRVRAKDAVTWLERHGTARGRDGMARYGLPSDHAVGVSMAMIQQLAKQVGQSHDVALELWKSGIYEARLLAAFVDEPARVTAAQMDRWCRDFDNWGVADTLCFKLFDRVPGVWGRIEPWAARRGEFQKRAAFALLASLALHDKAANDAAFVRHLPLIEKAASDDRNFVKKGVSWALRSIGRRNPPLRKAAIELATRLSASDDPTSRWIGKDTLKDLSRSLGKS